jgi:hypothetical protein
MVVAAAAWTASGGESNGSDRAFLDVNRDRFVSPLDALEIINRLNDQATAAAEAVASDLLAEGESAFADSSLESLLSSLAEDQLRRRSSLSDILAEI